MKVIKWYLRGVRVTCCIFLNDTDVFNTNKLFDEALYSSRFYLYSVQKSMLCL